MPLTTGRLFCEKIMPRRLAAALFRFTRSGKAPRTSACGERGFTLIEALVALMIMIAMVTMFYGSLSSALKISDHTGRTEVALRVAQSRLAASGIETPLRAGVEEGRDGDIGWRVDVRPYSAAGGDAQSIGLAAFYVSVTVSWRDRRGGKPRSLTLSTVKLERSG
jgi:general secretion pathway protein I